MVIGVRMMSFFVNHQINRNQVPAKSAVRQRLLHCGGGRRGAQACFVKKNLRRGANEARAWVYNPRLLCLEPTLIVFCL